MSKVLQWWFFITDSQRRESSPTFMIGAWMWEALIILPISYTLKIHTQVCKCIKVNPNTSLQSLINNLQLDPKTIWLTKPAYLWSIMKEERKEENTLWLTILRRRKRTLYLAHVLWWIALMKNFMSNLQAKIFAAIGWSLKERTYLHTCMIFLFWNRDSHRDLPNSNIPPLHFLDLIQENNMCTSQHKHGYSYKSDQSNGPSLKHITKNIQNNYNHILKVPASILLGLKLPPVATFVHHCC